MTPTTVIAEVRKLLQDTLAPFRYSDSDLLGYVNQVLKRIALIRPDLFTVIGDVTVTGSQVLQSLPSGAHRLVDIYNVKDGNAITETEREVLERAYPVWLSDPPGIPVNFMRHPRNPTKFFLYPRPAWGIVIVAEYSVQPSTYTLTDTLPLPDTYFSTMVDGVVFLASSIDDEHINTGRAKLFLDSFVQGLGVELKFRDLLDNDDGGVAKTGVQRRQQQ